VLRWKLVYIELQYWLLGLTPEHYHHYKAYIYCQLSELEGAVKHYRAYLGNTNDPRIRADLGYALGSLGRWDEALAEYQKVEKEWPHPAIILAVAEAHMRTGDIPTARQQVAKVDSAQIELEPRLQAAKEELLAQLH
jgi:tetratricopeptide (TPR) repeat protein